MWPKRKSPASCAGLRAFDEENKLPNSSKLFSALRASYPDFDYGEGFMVIARKLSEPDLDHSSVFKFDVLSRIVAESTFHESPVTVL
jgi:hypothetical protein